MLANGIAFSISVLFGVAYQHSLDSFDTNPRIDWYNDAGLLVLFVGLPIYLVARAPLDFARLCLGLLSSGRMIAYGIALIALSVAYEIVNLRLQFAATLRDVPMIHGSVPLWINVVGTPFIEEAFFHVGLQTKLERFGSVASIGATAVIFAAVHATRPDQLVSAFITHLPALILLGIAWNRYRSFGLCLIAHAGYDAVIYFLAKDSF